MMRLVSARVSMQDGDGEGLVSGGGGVHGPAPTHSPERKAELLHPETSSALGAAAYGWCWWLWPRLPPVLCSRDQLFLPLFFIFIFWNWARRGRHFSEAAFTALATRGVICVVWYAVANDKVNCRTLVFIWSQREPDTNLWDSPSRNGCNPVSSVPVRLNQGCTGIAAVMTGADLSPLSFLLLPDGVVW